MNRTDIFALLASATSSVSSTQAVLYFTPYDDQTLTVGDEMNVDININAHVPINAVGITVKFPPDLLEVVSVSKQKSFLDLWTEDTSIKEAAGEVHFSGGTTRSGGLLGTSTTLTLTVEAKQPGTATLSFENAQAYSSDGTGSQVTSRTHSITFTILATSSPATATNAAPASSAVTAALSIAKAPTPPSADFNGDGTVNLADMSILVIHMFVPYDPRYDLNMDGSVNIADLSILMSRMNSAK